MKRTDPEKKQEIIIYAILWGVVFILVPAVVTFRSLSTGMSFRMRDMLSLWLGILPFLVLFILHDLFAAPLLVEKGKSGAYAGVLVVLMVLFGGYVWMTRRTPERVRPGEPPMERIGDRPLPPGWKMGELPPDRPAPPGDGGLPMAPEAMKLVMGLLVLGVNLGVKYYLKSARGERRMQELQAENLSRQLETLRYQINPHFFMNTLNNIHALVDIDPEQAKASIEEFSKLMRHVLYEGDRPTIPLAKETGFLRHYISLMKLRYADTVRIDLSLPEKDEGAEIPPLMLASFVENAFKHGISYEKPSFVHVTVSVEDGKIVFRCANSRQDSAQTAQHGVGLANVRGRLDLLYGDRYTLHIDQNGDVYDVLLLLPATVKSDKEGV